MSGFHRFPFQDGRWYAVAYGQPPLRWWDVYDSDINFDHPGCRILPDLPEEEILELTEADLIKASTERKP